MAIRFRCPSCDRKLSAATLSAGTTMICPLCKTPIQVPKSSVIPMKEAVPESHVKLPAAKQVKQAGGMPSMKPASTVTAPGPTKYSPTTKRPPSTRRVPPIAAKKTGPVEVDVVEKIKGKINLPSVSSSLSEMKEMKTELVELRETIKLTSSDRDSLIEQLDRQQESNKRLEKYLDSLIPQIETQTVQRTQELQLALGTAQATLSEERREILKRHKEELDLLEKQCLQLVKRNEALEGDREDHLVHLNSTTAQLNTIIRQMIEERHENKRLRRKLSGEALSARPDDAAAKETFARLESQLQLELEHLRIERPNLQEAITTLKATPSPDNTEHARNACEKFVAHIDALSTRIEELQKAAHADPILQSRIEDMETEHHLLLTASQELNEQLDSCR